ncbi:ATP-binding protein [Thioflexithrix psekupsensis]|uniref:Histidine kinase/HSP90-like ATPase domain-containing protein n=1 Tax=Thioflexithrix psekupsensis TaxID=1570016 RepID=A0A251XB32_9GAMM|nr:ATP-binding protein [Thioflexithrix psekupsensis]OUD15367.1 hypothetical protein TPSD3_02220 [Thioflexithrix psekupsensis]
MSVSTQWAFLRQAKYEHRNLSLLLISLHIVLWWMPADPWLQLLMLVHIGLFLLWQPFWLERDLPDPMVLIGLGLMALVALVFFSDWFIAAWQILLISLLGGRDLVKPRDRMVNIVAILFLTVNLFVVSIHHLFVITEPIIIEWLVLESREWLKYFLLFIPATFWFIATQEDEEYRHHFDFFHGLILVLLLIIIALGSLVMMYETRVSYPLAVFQMSLMTALSMLLLSWIWVTFVGDGGIEQLWLRHLINFGVTFEQWLDKLAKPDNYSQLSPEQFLQAGLEQLNTLTWISGLRAHTLYGEKQLGFVDQAYYITIAFGSLEITAFSTHRISGSHYLHLKLLVQLLEYFHQIKRRETDFSQQARLKVIHETGAKLTHDIKNILQTLCNISATIESSQPKQFGDTQRLLQGQVPQLTYRLKRILDKLENPIKQSGDSVGRINDLTQTNIAIGSWWDSLKARYHNEDIQFISRIEEPKPLVFENLFNHVAENLLQNALKKRMKEPELKIEVSLFVHRGIIELNVCDNGSPIAEEVLRHLFTQPVTSQHNGYGTGLFHAATQARNNGYVLSVTENDLQVCFCFTNQMVG